MRSLSIPVLAFLCAVCLATNASAGQRTHAITQVWQHKDTGMLCAPAGDATVHAWNHATVCIHCGTYCAPAACAMYAIFWGSVPPQTNQDDIYDNAKLSGGEVIGNGILDTHGLGMYAGTGGHQPEVQTAFAYAVGVWPFQWGPQGTALPLLTHPIVVVLIDYGKPILWIDMANWPSDQETLPEEILYDSGHCKSIAGYDDMDTADFNDDQYLIYDPWPNSGSPYWQTQITVIDPNDIYLAVWDGIGTEEAAWGTIKLLFGR